MSRLTKALLIALAVLVIATIALSYGPGWIIPILSATYPAFQRLSGFCPSRDGSRQLAISCAQARNKA